jgi:hypothetical protein
MRCARCERPQRLRNQFREAKVSLKNALGFISSKIEDMLFMLYNFSSYNAKLRLERTLFFGKFYGPTYSK